MQMVGRSLLCVLAIAFATLPIFAEEASDRAHCFSSRHSAEQRLLSCAKITGDEKRPPAERSAAYASQGRVYISLKAWNRALAAFDAAIDLYPHSAAYDGRGAARAKTGDPQLAVSDFTHAILLNERNANAYNNRSVANVELRNFDQAVEDALAAVRISALNPTYLNQLAWAYLRTQRADIGLQYVNRALKLDPRFANAYDTRGSIHEALGEQLLAIADFKRALSLDPTLTSSTDALARLSPKLETAPSLADVIRLIQSKGWAAHLGGVCAEFELLAIDPCEFKQISLEDDGDGRGYPRGFNVPAADHEFPPQYLLIFHLTPLVGEFFVLSADGTLLRAYYRSRSRGYERIPNEDVQDEFNADLRYWTENLDKVAHGLSKK